MSTESDKPFQWPGDGILKATVVRDYLTWLSEKLDLEWEAPGVIRRKPSGQRQPKRGQKPHQLRKSSGWLNIQKDLRPLAVYVLLKLKPWSDRTPYVPQRKVGMAFVKDLRAFDGHVQLLLKQKKTEQSKRPKSDT